MKRLFPICVLLLLSQHNEAQDLHFLQFQSTPLLQNPAMTGLIPDDFRFTADVQTGSAPGRYTGRTASFDAALLKDKLPKGDALGLGIFAVLDDFNHIRTDLTGGFSVAYHKAIGHNKKAHISAGIQGNYTYQKINEDVIVSTSTLVNGVWVTNISGSGNIQMRSQYPHYATGVMYSSMPTKRSSFFAGYSAYQLLAPKMVLADYTWFRIHVSNQFYAGYTYEISNKFSATVSSTYQFEHMARSLITGSYVSYSISKDDKQPRSSTIQLGFHYYYLNMIAPYAAVEINRTRFAVNLYRETNPYYLQLVNGLEVSLTYFDNARKKRGTSADWHCPRIY